MAAETVLFVQPTAEAGGSEVAMTRLVTHLDPSRYRPVVVLPDEGAVALELEAAGVEVRTLPMAQLSPLLSPRVQGGYAVGYLKTVRRLRRLAGECDAAIIHSNSLYSLYGAMAGHTIGGARHVWHVREIVDGVAAARRALTHLAKRRADRLICVSQAVADQFPSVRRAVVCHDGVDTEAFTPKRSGQRIRAELGIPADAQVAGLVARLDPWKGISTFLAVAERVARTKPDVHFVLCGGELSGHREYAEMIRNRAAQTLGERIHLTEWRYGPSDMPDVYAAIDVLLHTAISPEPFGLSLIEAMASAKPVIAGRAGGPLEIVSEGVTGELIEPGAVAGYVDATLRLLDDRQAAADMGLAGRGRCEELFSLRRHATQVQEIYDSVLGRRPRTGPVKPARKLTVITVNFNGGRELGENVAAWWSGRDRDWAMSLVDNASSDGSVEQVLALCPGVHVIRNSANIGFTAATNQALRDVDSEYVLLLNPDVRVDAAGIRKALEYLEGNPTAGIAGARMVLPSGKVDPAAHRSFKTPSTYLYKMTGLSRLFPRLRSFGKYYRSDISDARIDPVDVDSVTGAFLMIRRRTLDDIGLLDEHFFMYCEDEDWCWRAKQHRWRVVYLPAIDAFHNKGSSARQRQFRTTWEWHRSLWLYHRKNIAPEHALPVNVAVYAGMAGVLAVRFPSVAIKKLLGRLRR